MRTAWLAALVILGCKAEVKTSAQLDLAGRPVEDEPAPGWDESTAAPGPRGPRAIEAPAHWEGPPTATYPGFQVFEDGTSRVFIEIAGGSVAVKEMHHEGVFRYRFEGVRVPERVNRLPLPTVHFETPVSLVEIAQIGSDAELIIHMRHRSQPNARLERSASGTVLSVDFPFGASDEPASGGPSAAPLSATERAPAPPPPTATQVDDADELSTRR
jgi:hypothetical protein